MPFSPEQKLDICKIMRVTPTVLNAHLASLGTDLTEDKVTAVGAEIARWNTGVGNNFADFEPTESNEGFKLKSRSAKNDIRANIATILEMTAPSDSSIGTICIGN